jgi:D-alanyl-D-alanine carboxypeptidase (penicillin-binding protein 5/6)
MGHTAPAQGMTGISYTDASGLDPATTSTAADQVRLGMAAMHVPALAEIAALPTAVIPVAGVIRNTNKLLGEDAIAGLRTGSTQAGGGCLLVAAWTQADRHKTLIEVAVLGQPGTAGTILASALQAGHNLVLALDRAIGAGRQSGSRHDSEGPPQGPPGAP